MPSKIQLVNRTLSELGKLAVASVNETESSQYVSAKIDELYPELLLDCAWDWAIVYREDSSPVSSDFSPDYEYTYALPGNFGSFYKWASTGSQWPIYEFVDGYLLAQTNPVQYYYIRSDANYTDFSVLMARALVLYTAAKSAPTLTNNMQLAAYLEKEYEKKRIEAIIENRMRQSIQQVPYNDFDRIQYI